jgi:dienelactone hydrolase
MLRSIPHGRASAKMLCAVLFTAIRLSGAVPEQDCRQTELADFRTHFTMPRYATRKQWEARKSQLRQKILSAAGLLPMLPKASLRPKVVRRLEYADYSIETVLLETLPGYYLGGNLYRPLRKKGRLPAVLLPHGHWKKGRLENQPVYSVPALGINLARQGYVVFAYDMVGYNDTRQTPHSFGGWAETLWSFHPLGLQLWNSIRALDYLTSLPDVDAHRIAATGASGGASQTFLLTAVDDRIGYAAPVNMISAYMQGGDPCEEAPNLRVDTFNVEIAAMTAPRPMLVVSSTRDWTRHTPTEEFPAIRRIYELYGAAGNVQNAHIDAEHNYNRQSREAVYQFLARNMQPELAYTEIADQEVAAPSDEDLLAFPSGPPADLEGFGDVFQAWRSISILQTQEAGDSAELRDAMRFALGAEWPADVESAAAGERIVLTRKDARDRVEGLWFPGKGAPVLIVHAAGSAAALRDETGARFARSGRPVLIIEPFTSQATRIQREYLDEYFLSYNRTDAADRVQDILTALAFLKTRGRGRPTLIGLGAAGIWCVFAAAVAPIDIYLVADLNGFGGSDEDFHNRFFVPGIQRAGGLSAALRLVNHVRTLMPATSRTSEGKAQ